jgi:hypothetical protein
MPPVVIAAGIAAAGTLGGAALASRSSNKATDASSKANAEALAYTKEQETTRRADYAQAQQAYQRQWEAWNAQRMALLQRYGVDVSGMQAPQTQLTMPPNAQPLMGGGRIDPRTANAVGAAAQGGHTVADILGRGADPSQWNDWKQYGLPS